MQRSYQERVEHIFNNLSVGQINLADEFYDSRVRFVDPLGEHLGIDSVKSYYKKLYDNVEEIKFTFHNHIAEGDQLSSVWTMRLRARGLNSGKPVSLDGCSVFRFEPNSGKVIYHRDYFDMGEFVYEKIPVLKNLIEFIKKRLRS